MRLTHDQTRLVTFAKNNELTGLEAFTPEVVERAAEKLSVAPGRVRELIKELQTTGFGDVTRAQFDRLLSGDLAAVTPHAPLPESYAMGWSISDYHHGDRQAATALSPRVQAFKEMIEAHTTRLHATYTPTVSDPLHDQTDRVKGEAMDALRDAFKTQLSPAEKKEALAWLRDVDANKAQLPSSSEKWPLAAVASNPVSHFVRELYLRHLSTPEG